MERPVELLVLTAIVVVISVVLLGPHPGSLRRQAVVGVAIGVMSAFVVVTQQTDLIPDGLELPLLAIVGLAIALVGLREYHRRTRLAHDRGEATDAG